MDDHRFDALTRTAANRRQVVRRLGGGGLMAAFGTALGLRTATAQPAACTLAVRATVRLGPSAGQLLTAGSSIPGFIEGDLSLNLNESGNVQIAEFTTQDSASFAVRGEISGRSVLVRVELADDRALVLQGVGSEPLHLCQGQFDGSMIGPLEGDLGDWHASATESASRLPAGSSANANAQVATAIPQVTPTATVMAPPTAQPTATCAPATSDSYCSDTMCGSWDDGCGSSFDCGFPCANVQVCYLGYCCYPQEDFIACQGKCGQVLDACGLPVQCADCPSGFNCSNETCCADTGTFCLVNVDCCSGSCSMLNGCQ